LNKAASTWGNKYSERATYGDAIADQYGRAQIWKRLTGLLYRRFGVDVAPMVTHFNTGMDARHDRTLPLSAGSASDSSSEGVKSRPNKEWWLSYRAYRADT